MSSPSSNFNLIPYDGFLDIISKRTGLVNFLSSEYHLKQEGQLFSLKEKVDDLLLEFFNLPDRDDTVEFLVNEFKTYLYKTLNILDTHPKIPRTKIHSNLTLSCLFHDKFGNIYLTNEPESNYVYDYMYDYASLRARSSTHSRYTSMLANENLLTAIKIKYKDLNAGTRYIMYAVIIDFIDFLTVYIKASKGESLDNISTINQNIIYVRVLEFITKSYTTIDHFIHVYH